MNVTKELYGMHGDTDIFKFVIENDNGMRVSAINYGCAITEILAPDKDGKLENVVLGFDSFKEYEKNPPHFGAVIGRVTGRISGSRFKLKNQVYTLPSNEGENHLHGNGELDHAVWNYMLTGRGFGVGKAVGIEFSYESHDGSNGYPGCVNITVTYTLDNMNRLMIEYRAATDTDTILNLTNHSYFNLSGDAKRTVEDHILKCDAERFLPLNSDLTPNGRIRDVCETTFDFSGGHTLRVGMESEDEQNIIAGHGYDHALVFGNCKDYSLYTRNPVHSAVLYDEKSGRKLTMETDYPCFVCYSGNQLPKKHNAVCLEAQLLPDAVNHRGFGSTVLKPNKEYRRFVSYQFGIDLIDNI